MLRCELLGGYDARPLQNTSRSRLSGWPVPSGWLQALVLPLIVLSWLAVVVIAGWLLGHVARTLLLVALSGITAFALTPLGDTLARWMPHPVALALAYVLGVGAFLGVSVYVVATTASQVTSLVGDLPAYAARLQQLEPQVAMLGLPLNRSRTSSSACLSSSRQLARCSLTSR